MPAYFLSVPVSYVSRLARKPVMFISAAGLMLTACFDQPAPNAQAPVAEVVVEEIKIQSIALTHEFPGRTLAFQSSQVRPQISGLLQQRLFTEGADVQAGQTLYLVEPAPYQAALDEAKADVLSARPKAERYRQLAKLDAISRQESEDALAALRKSEAAVKSAQIDLDNTRIKAPISGRIGTSNYTAGALVSAEQSEALATINQLDPIYVDVAQSSAQWLALRRQVDAGQVVTVNGKPEVQLVMEDGVAYPHKGTLEVVDAAVKASTGSVKLRAVFANPDHLILPGMYVKAKVAMATNNQAILAPQKAVTRNNKGEAVVLLVGDDGKVEQRVINVGDTVGDRWVVTRGLNAGEKIIVEGGQRARAGQTVKIVSPVPAPEAANAAGQPG
ncbi:efflux RND transporter periplasmic adaptor subunit [Brenneria populi subsp. brevivirga]|uniref:efflux RND transporter periplasmic adaptor subunit n=1 Tax=Brenneria populi TaxID=1505588 RepID=UPI002E19390F|nr:efflux RND transporter periplasmic adaptor subunit [Brenneria populi subsp. brevivirga]